MTAAVWAISLFAPSPAHAHHGSNLFATATAETVHPGHNVAAVQGAYFRPDLGPSTGQRIELTPMFLRGISEDFHLETHLHLMTNPEKGLDSGLLEGFAIGGRHRLADFGSEEAGEPFRLAFGAQIDIPTAHAMDTLGAGPGGLFHLILSRESAGGITFAANLSSSLFTHLECVEGSPVMAEASRRQEGGAEQTESTLPAPLYAERQGSLQSVRRQHAHLEAGTCSSRVPQTEFEWGFSLGIRKHLAGNLAAGAELAREVEYPPGMATIIGFYWTPEPEWLVRWGVAFPTGFEEDVISLRLGAALSF